MKYLVVCNGNLDDINLIKNLAEEVDCILCADGGIRHLIKAGILPDLIIGDLDSIDDKTRKKIKKKSLQYIKFPTKKDKTDTELAIDYAIDNNAKEIILIGATGTRLDHTMANIMLLNKLVKLGVKGRIIDKNNEIYLVNRQLSLEKKENTYVSIIPLLDDTLGVTLRGFEYEVENLDFKISSTLGISNKIVKDKGYIKIDRGPCLVFVSKD